MLLHNILEAAWVAFHVSATVCVCAGFTVGVLNRPRWQERAAVAASAVFILTAIWW
jgi:hypothetical protein